jgi:hypothetical protein
MKAVRTCLGLDCGKSFASGHSANRICNSCKTKKNRKRFKPELKSNAEISADRQKAALAAHFYRNVVAG